MKIVHKRAKNPAAKRRLSRTRRLRVGDVLWFRGIGSYVRYCGKGYWRKTR